MDNVYSVPGEVLALVIKGVKIGCHTRHVGVSLNVLFYVSQNALKDSDPSSSQGNFPDLHNSIGSRTGGAVREGSENVN